MAMTLKLWFALMTSLICFHWKLILQVYHLSVIYIKLPTNVYHFIGNTDDSIVPICKGILHNCIS